MKAFKSFQTSIPSKRDSSRESKFEQKHYSLDVSIHHRIWDAQKHLLQTLVKQKKKTVDN